MNNPHLVASTLVTSVLACILGVFIGAACTRTVPVPTVTEATDLAPCGTETALPLPASPTAH